MRYLILLFLFGCSTQLTEEEQLDREYEEVERKNTYILWERSCIDNGGVIYSYNPTRRCPIFGGCIPHRSDWAWNSNKERPELGNSFICVSQKQLDGLYR